MAKLLGLFASIFWGFILTMWNVNIKESYISDDDIESFILTMWNVNKLVPLTPPFLERVLS